MPQQVTRPETDNYQSLLAPKTSRTSRRRRSSCALILGIIFLLTLILIPVGLLLWRYYHSEIVKLKQSPVNIITSKASFDPTLGNGNFVFNYNPESFSAITNTGHGWLLKLNDGSNDTLTAVHLPGTYKLVQVHAHWDQVGSNNGSEHTVNGLGYAGEIHLVHFNLKYKTFYHSLHYPDGLAVLGVFLTEKDNVEENEELNTIVENLKYIVYKNQTVYPDKLINIRNLIPENTNEFWTYEGSLTTAPFSEAVIWTVFRQSIPISSLQLQEFRQLKTITEDEEDDDDDDNHHYDKHHEKDGDNDISGFVRYPQPLNGRVVKSSFKWGARRR